MLRVGWVKFVDATHEEVARSSLVILCHLLVADEHVLVLLVAHEEVLELLSVDVLRHTIALHQEETWVSDCLRGRQELALILDILTVFDAWRGWLLIVDAFDHLVQIERDRELLCGVTISIDDEVVTLLILRPDATLLQVSCVDTRATLARDTKQLKEVVVVVHSKVHLLANAVQVLALVGRDHDDLTVLTDFDH